MKTVQILSSLFLASALLTSACTPADKAVTDSQTRLTIQQKLNRKGGGGAGTNKAFMLGGFQFASLLMDKQIEAIEMVRLAILADDGTKSGTQRKNKTDSAEGYTALISLDSAPLSFTTDKGQFESKTTKNLNVAFTQEAGQDAWQLKIYNEKGSSSKQVVDLKNAGKKYINFFESTYKIEAAAKSLDQKDLVIDLETSGNLNGTAGVGNYDMKVTILVDKDSLLTESVKIKKMTGMLNFKAKEGGKVTEVQISGNQLELKPQGLCNVLLGSSVIETDPKKRRVEFTEDAVAISDTKFKWSFAECSRRPTVDLSRLLP